MHQRTERQAATAAEIIAFEARWPRPGGWKDQAIRAQLGLAPARYYALLLRAADSLEGIAADPVTARRVRERSDRRAEQRARRAA